MMNIKDRAAYAWGRICSLFKKKKPEIEVAIEEQQKETTPFDEYTLGDENKNEAKIVVSTEETILDNDEEVVDDDLSPDDIEVEIYEEAEETAEEYLSSEKTDRSCAVLTPNEEVIPSRMTDEYIAWMKAQRKAADTQNNRAPFEAEQ